MSNDARKALWVSAASKVLAAKPELLADLLFANQNLWSGEHVNPENDSFSRSLLNRAFSTKFGSGATDLASAVGGPWVAGGVAATSFWDRISSMSRADRALEFWRQHPDFVVSAIKNLPEIERATHQIAKLYGGSVAVTPLGLAAERSLERLESLYGAGLPRLTDPPSLLTALAGGTNASPAAGIEGKAVAALKEGIDKGLKDEELFRYVDDELAKLTISQHEIRDEVENFISSWEAVLAKDTEARDLAKAQADAIAVGQLAGHLIGLVNPKAGSALTTFFEQSSVLFGAFSAGLTVVSMASGVGALLAIGNAFSALDQGPTLEEEILSALQGGFERIALLMEVHFGTVINQIRGLSNKMDTGFALLGYRVDKIASRLARVESSRFLADLQIQAINMMSLTTRLELTLSAQDAAEACVQAYMTALGRAASEDFTGEHTSDRGALTRELASILRERDPASTQRWRMTGEQILAVSRFLELYPTLLCDARKMLSLAGSEMADGERSNQADQYLRWPPQGMSARAAGAFGSNLTHTSALLLPLSAIALTNLASVYRQALLNPTLRPPGEDIGTLLADCALALQVQRRLPLVLASEAVRSMASEQWLRSVESVLNEIATRRFDAVNFRPRAREHSGPQPGQAAVASAAACAGATRLIGAGGELVFELMLPDNPFTLANIPAYVDGRLPSGVEFVGTVAVPRDRLGLTPINVDSYADTVLVVASYLQSIGYSIQLQTLDIRSAGRADWHGPGDLTEVLQMSCKALDNTEFLIGAIEVVDRRRGLPEESVKQVTVGGRMGYDATEIGGWTEVTIHARPSLSPLVIRIDRGERFEPGEYCPGTVDQRAEKEVRGFLDEASRSNWTTATLAALRKRLAVYSIEPKLKILTGSNLLEIVRRLQSQRWAALPSMATQLDGETLENAHRAWQFALTSCISALDNGGRLTRTLNFLGRCPEWLRDDLHTGMLSRPESQLAFGGVAANDISGAASVDELNRRERSLWMQLRPRDEDRKRRTPGVALLLDPSSLSCRICSDESGPGEEKPLNFPMPAGLLDLRVASIMPSVDRALRAYEDALLLTIEVLALAAPKDPGVSSSPK